MTKRVCHHHGVYVAYGSNRTDFPLNISRVYILWCGEDVELFPLMSFLSLISRYFLGLFAGECLYFPTDRKKR